MTITSFEEAAKRRAVEVRQRLMHPCTDRLVASYEEKIRRLEDQLESARTARVQSMEALIANERRAIERCNELEAMVERLQERLRRTFVTVGDFAAEVEKRDLMTPDDIVRQVLLSYPEVTLEAIRSSSREHYLTEPRGWCMYRVHKLRPDLSFPRLGRFFNRDHSTVMHACRKMALKERREMANVE